MKKFLIMIITLSFCLSGCGNNKESTTNNQVNTYNAERTITLDNNNNDDTDYNINNETEISSFSTKIYTPNDSARQNNIQLTCSALSETVVKSRRNFFFLQYGRKSYS